MIYRNAKTAFMNYRYFFKQHSSVLTCAGLFLAFFLIVLLLGSL